MRSKRPSIVKRAAAAGSALATLILALTLAVIVALGAMGMVEVAIHQVIDVIPVGYCLVSAVHAVNMRLIMSGTAVGWCAFLRIHRVHLNAVVVHGTIVQVMQVAIVQIVRMAIVFQGRMATIGAVLVAVST